MAWFKKIREARRPFCTALVAAGGSSERMGTGHTKLLEWLDGVPVLAHTLRALEEAETVNAIVIAAREEDILPFSELCKTYGITKPVKIVLGGKDREESVYRAALEADPRTEFLAVQDGARPLVTPELIDAVVTAAFRCNAAAPALPVRDTVKRREGDRVTLRLEGQDYPARIERIGPPEGDVRLLVLSISRGLQNLTALREVNVRVIFRTWEGLRIPAEAVYVSDGETGVYVVSGARVKWKKVEILWDSGTFLVVSDSGSLRVGDAVLLTDEPVADGDILP